jgi:hypothetical protein
MIPRVIERGASGPNPNSGTVGPKMATVGVPMAEARCNGDESFVTSTVARAMSSADASSDSFPVASMTRAPACSAIAEASSLSADEPTSAIRPPINAASSA